MVITYICKEPRMPSPTCASVDLWEEKQKGRGVEDHNKALGIQSRKEGLSSSKGMLREARLRGEAGTSRVPEAMVVRESEELRCDGHIGVSRVALLARER